MTHQENVETVKRLYAAFGTGDVQSLLGMLDEGVEWAVPGGAPWSGEGRGRQHVQAFFEKFGASASLATFEPRSFVADGDTVVVIGYEEGTSRQTGGQWKAQFAHVFRVVGGRISAHREYIDTQAIALALRG